MSQAKRINHERLRQWLMLLMASTAFATAMAVRWPSFGFDVQAMLEVICGVVVMRLILVGVVPHASPRMSGWSLNLALAAVFIGNFATRHWGAAGEDPSGLEMDTLTVLANVAVVAASAGVWATMQRVAGVASLFVMLYAFAMAGSVWVYLGTIVYLIASVFRFQCEHWRDWQVAASVWHPAARQPGRSRWIPLGIVLSVTLGSLVVGTLAYPEDPETIQEFASRLFGRARGGDENQSAHGHLDRSQGRSALNDYGNDLDADAAGDLASNLHARLSGVGNWAARMARQDGRLNLEQPLDTRGQTKPFDGVVDRKSEHLLDIKGTPGMTIPITTYRLFDGQVWQNEPASVGSQVSAQLADEGLWLKAINWMASSPRFAGDAQQDFRAAENASDNFCDFARNIAASLWASDRDAVITPQLMQLNAGILDQFRSTPAGVEEFEYLLTHYDVQALLRELQANPSQLEKWNRLLKTDDRVELLLALERWKAESQGAHLAPRLKALLQEWIGDADTGWPQIEAVIAGLRSHCKHDRQAEVPLGVNDSVAYFLLESRRGPDYLFASSATVLLRSLGYPSRMAGGFYSDPEHHRWLTSTTSMTPQDVHFWTQVQLPDGTWLDLEPTPGYAPLTPPPSRLEWLGSGLKFVYDRCQEQRFVISAILVPLLLLVLFRRRLTRGVMRCWWWLRVGRAADGGVLATWRLLELRARHAGVGRPRNQTLRGWYLKLFAKQPMAYESLAKLAAMSDWVSYNRWQQGNPLPWSPAEIGRVCRDAVQLCQPQSRQRVASRELGSRERATSCVENGNGNESTD